MFIILEIQRVKESSNIDSRQYPRLVSIAIVTVIALYLRAPELSRCRGQRGLAYYSDGPLVQRRVTLPSSVVPAEGPGVREAKGRA